MDSFVAAVLQVKLHLRSIEPFSLEMQKKMQESQLRVMFSHAYSHSDWWCKRLACAGYKHNELSLFEVLSSLPPLLRSDLQENFEAMRAWQQNWSAMDIFISTTSGSTGLPVRVEKFKSAYNVLYGAVSLIDHEWHNRDARLSLAILSENEDSVRPDWGTIFAAIQGSGSVNNRFASSRPLSEHTAWLRDFKPAYLKATSFRAASIAEFIIQQDKTLPLRQIMSQYERVTPRQRDLCRKAFGAEIIDRYSCEECGWLALQCPKHEHLHVMSGTTIIEIVDENLHHCPVGVPGRVLVTSLYSYAMPIIRYDIGDIAEWGEACDCGIKLPVIKRLWGRKRNSVRLPDGELRPMAYLGDDVANISVIKEFRLIQQKNGDIDFLIRSDRSLTEKESALLCSYILKIDPHMVVTIREVSVIDWGDGLKREEFIRLDT